MSTPVGAGSGNLRVVEKALAALPGGIEKIYLRGDSALYEHELMRFLDERAIGYAISADMSPQLAECAAALPEEHWKADRHETDAIREWAEVNYLPSDGIWKKDAVSPRRYLATRIRARQGELLRDGNRVRHFCIVTKRSDPKDGSGLDLIRWHRQKAGTIEHAHDVLMNELAGAAPRQRRLAAAQRHPLQLALGLRARRPTRGITHRAPQTAAFFVAQHRRKGRPSRPRDLLRCSKEIARALAGPPRTRFALNRPALAGV